MYILLYSIWMNQYSWDVPDMIWIFCILSSSVHDRIQFGVAMFDMLTLTPFGDVLLRFKTRALRARAKLWRRQYWPHVLLRTTWAQVPSRGSWLLSRQIGPQNPSKFDGVNNEMLWLVIFWWVYLSKKHFCWWFWGFPNLETFFLNWMKMKTWSKSFSRSPLGLTFPEKSNILKWGPWY